MKTNSVTVTAINLFPVRSCAGQSMQVAEITPHGLMFDRQWRLMRPSGEFLTQRECPKMALLRPLVQNSILHLSFGNDNHCPIACQDDLNGAPVQVYEKWQGIDQGNIVADWLLSVLGVEARLLRVVINEAPADFARPDMSPVLVISEESLIDLNTRLETPVLINRFRPNIVVSGLEPYGEEAWERVKIGEVEYVASSELCGRCVMINVDQEKGEKTGKEPLKTLARYHRTKNIPIFGKYMVPVTSGLVRVNDSVSDSVVPVIEDAVNAA